MAAYYTWPPSLPQSVQVGFTESVGVNVLKTSMDAGPAKIRRRGKKSTLLNTSFIMTSTQVITLEDFITNTIKGAYRFYFTHPRTNTQVEVRIIPQNEGEYFSCANIAGEYFNIGMQMEVLP